MRSLYWKMPVNNPMDLLKFNLLFAHIYFCSDVYNIFVSFFYITFFLVFYLRIFADLLHFLINVQLKNWFVCSTNYLRGKQFLLYLFSLSFSLFIIHSIYVTWNWFFFLSSSFALNGKSLLKWIEKNNATVKIDVSIIYSSIKNQQQKMTKINFTFYFFSRK